MTNNLKAERTLTAEELQAIIDGCEGLPEGPYSAHDHEADLLDGKGRWMALWHGDPIWHHFARMDPQTVKAMALELLALRSQSISTQQPMGQVTDEMAKRASDFLWNNVGLMDFAHATGPDDLDEIMKSAISAAGMWGTSERDMANRARQFLAALGEEK